MLDCFKDQQLSLGGTVKQYWSKRLRLGFTHVDNDEKDQEGILDTGVLMGEGRQLVEGMYPYYF